MVRLFLFSNHPLFRQGLERLLDQDPELEIVGREADLEKALLQIKVLQPDVVLVDNGDLECDPTPAVLRVLREQGSAKVIGLNLIDNVICVYHGEKRVVSEVKDLVEVIKYASPISPSVEPEDLHPHFSTHRIILQ